MPCYDPPEDDKSRLANASSQMDRYVACLKEIEQACIHDSQRTGIYRGLRTLPKEVMDIIDRHFGDRTW